MAGSPVGLCPFSFSLRLHPSMRCFFVSFLSSGFLPSGCLFPSPLSLSSRSLRVSCFPFCFRTFPLGSSSALLSVLSSGLFRHWAFPFLARSRFLVLPLLVFSLINIVGGFVYTISLVVLFLVSGLWPLAIWFVSFGRCPVLFLLWCCSLPSLYSGFFVQCLCLLSLRFLVLCVCSLAPLSALFQGCFVVSCPYLASFSCSS